MITIEISKEQHNELFDNFMHAEHYKVRLKNLALYLKGLSFPHKEICRICRITKPTLIKYLNEFSDNGLGGITELKWKGQPSKLNDYRDLIDNDFENNPPKLISEARDRIEKLTGIKRCPTQIRGFLKKLNYKFLKVGSVPGNGDGKDKQREEEREEFKKKVGTTSGRSRKSSIIRGCRTFYFCNIAWLCLVQIPVLYAKSGWTEAI